MATTLLITLMIQSAAPAPGTVVVLGADAPAPVQFAADELSRYVEKASGVSAGVERRTQLNGRNVVALVPSGHRLGQTVRMPDSTDEEAFRISSTAGGGRTLAGRSPRAVVYAVYDFLEQEVGYRWYFPYPEDALTPKLSPQALAKLLGREVDRQRRPAFSFREREFRDMKPATAATDARIIQQIDWWAKLGMNRFLLNFHYAMNRELWKRWKGVLIPEIKRRGMLVGLGEHGSYPMFLPSGRYGREHPQWYCEVDGRRLEGMRLPNGAGAQFCTTNAEAVRTYLDNFAAFVRENPEVDFYYPAPNDVSKWCECKACSRLSVADRYMRLDNQVAEMLQRVKPGTRVMHLAYANHRLPPKETLPHPMIDVDVACWGRDLSFSLCDPRTMPDNKEYLDVFRRWAKVREAVPGDTRPRLLYHCKLMRHYWLGVHLLPLEVIDDDFACARELGLDGFDFPLGFLGMWTKALNTYVVARKCWEPDTPVAQWVDRFLSDCYGDKAGEARKIHELAEQAFADRRYGRSLTLSWHPERISVRAGPLAGLAENARKAVARLDEATAMAARSAGGNDAVAGRFRKLLVVLRRARDEQQMLVHLGVMGQAYRDFENADLDAKRRTNRKRAMDAWQATKATNDTLAAGYSLHDDLAGLYWAGATHEDIDRALSGWHEALSGFAWHQVGTWETADFEKMNKPVTKTFDVTDRIAGLPAGKVRVRFLYKRGELGISTISASLWARAADGKETRLSKDKHGGFAGYEHKNASYDLRMKTPPSKEMQYFIKAEFGAYGASGKVAERGSHGVILLGIPE